MIDVEVEVEVSHDHWQLQVIVSSETSEQIQLVMNKLESSALISLHRHQQV